MTPAGSILIDLHHRFGNATGVQIASSRPDTVAQVLIGKTPEQALDTVPLLFTLCGNAQAYAALLACRAALGMATEPDIDSARELLVQLETLREHAWRILLDWPLFIGLAQDKTALATLLKFDALFKRHLFRHGEAFKLDSRLDVDAAQLTKLIDALEALIDVSIFNGRLADFQALTCEAQLLDWLWRNDALPAKLLNYLYSQDWGMTGQNDIACLPKLDAEALNRQILREDLTTFTRIPRWQGRCFEVTLLNRQWSQPLISEMRRHYGNGLIVRMLARLLEVALIPFQLRQLLAQIKNDAALPINNTASNGIGLAQVQAARGLLIHRLALRQGRVHDYRIIAPTEWNFHPEGVVAQGLKQLTAQSLNDLQRQAELYINAVDPCVQYALNLTDSRNEIEAHA
ncbi:nickel-dependent hydrogenase large subunit [Methylobacter tundripaludum]|uniref:Ni,Fe-hydrogenase I large subunit n=1 Tax=Methylobacter tundripaludum (strain ATCC BAA-1195 / DSM 17260 / SV96) TaxID=697282 RepID=G3J1A5_METTV|nr:nickel-dependent hydrogenase large subunit [Methylobacter tundripaludum]EGW20977.1 Ni,Fe-hydrogenase I large subunit [Methylobacter tundripaludum SV96]